MKSIADQRREQWKLLEQLMAEKRAEQDKLDAEDIANPMEEEEWYSRMDAIDAKYDDRISQCSRRHYWLGYKSCRNTWFKGFVESFGLCESRKISHKQAEIFMRYCETQKEYQNARGMRYLARVGNFCVKCSVYGDNRPAYVTIIEF